MLNLVNSFHMNYAIHMGKAALLIFSVIVAEYSVAANNTDAVAMADRGHQERSN